MNLVKPCLIFTAWREHMPDQINRDSQRYVKRALTQRGVNFTVAQGCYKGACEPSLIVIDTARARAIVQGFARLFEQESILAVDVNRQARLETCDGELIRGLGTLRHVQENVARACDSWSRVGAEFYTTDTLTGVQHNETE